MVNITHEHISGAR